MALDGTWRSPPPTANEAPLLVQTLVCTVVEFVSLVWLCITAVVFCRNGLALSQDKDFTPSLIFTANAFVHAQLEKITNWCVHEVRLQQ